MKSKIKISLFVLLIIGVIVVNVLYKNKDRDDKTKPKSNLAIMIDENGNGNYTSASSIPKGSYALVEEKTVCENGGKVASYNNLTGQIGFSFLGSDRCSLYFEKISSPTISNVSVSGSTLRASFNSKKSLCCYAITTSTSEPSDWTDISGSSYELSTSLTSSGTYYLWLKDSYGNVTRYEDSIVANISKGWETILINNNDGTTTNIDALKSYFANSKTLFDFSNPATTDLGLYAAVDDLGMSYYFRGAVNDNWVKFGKDSSGNDLYWRIIRINGDGSIRMIYTGTTAPTSSTSVTMTGSGTITGTSFYNESVTNPVYSQYMYEIDLKTSLQYGITTSSSIKTKIDYWYKTTTLETDAKTRSYISDSIFCADRTASHTASGTYGDQQGKGGGTPELEVKGTTSYYFGAYGRLFALDTGPSLKCSQDLDKFTVSTDNGNGALTYPVGLISADEMVAAGAVYDEDGTRNTSFYLYNNQAYWMISPNYYTSSNARVFALSANGVVSNPVVTQTTYGIRPVINLSKDVILSGSGTYDDVYTVS